jgi:hypothetical protein
MARRDRETRSRGDAVPPPQSIVARDKPWPSVPDATAVAHRHGARGGAWLTDGASAALSCAAALTTSCTISSGISGSASAREMMLFQGI